MQSLAAPATLVEQAEREKPLLVMADVEPREEEVCAAIAALKANRPTAHLPVIAFASASRPGLSEAARVKNATTSAVSRTTQASTMTRAAPVQLE